jgi:hypothetical protein
MILVPTNTIVNGIVPSPLHLCFDATNTVTVAGGGSTFVVEPGGSAVMIAGVKISYLYGTTVQPGGYMHGYITTTGSYCGSLPPAMVAVVTGVTQGQQEPVAESPTFTLYPNPTTGSFTLLNKGDMITGSVQVEVYGMCGERILATSWSGDRSHRITLPPMPPGLCFVKVIAGDRVESFKLVVTR